MALAKLSEKELEDHIVHAMTQPHNNNQQGKGYILGNSKDFDKAHAIDTALFWQFLQQSQQYELDKLAKHNPNY